MEPFLTPQELAGHYANLFLSPSGEIVMQDLTEAFVERLNPALEADMERFPHPYRPYVEIGQRLVVQKIQAAVASNQFTPLFEETPDEPV